MDRPLTVNFKSVHSNISWRLSVHAARCRRVLELSHENEHGVGVKESVSENYSRWMQWQHAQEFTSVWTMVATNVMIAWQCTLRATVGQQDVHWLQVRAWQDCSYMTGIIPPLAHGLTVKLSPCLCSHSSLAGRIAACLCGHSKCNLLLAQAAPGWFSIFLVYM